MARKYQEGEPLQTVTTRMGAAMLARIDAYGARLKAHHPALRIERADAIRDLLLKGLAVGEGNGPSGPGDAERGPGDAGGGPVKAPVTLGEAPGEDHSPHGAVQSSQKAAKTKDQPRTTGPAPDHVRSRTGRKRAKAPTEG